MSSILRKHLSAGWTGVPNATIRDKAISFRATGLLVYLLSMDDGWPMDVTTIAGAKGREGRDALYTAMKELQDAGYVRRRRLPGAGTEVLVSDTPRAASDWSPGPTQEHIGLTENPYPRGSESPGVGESGGHKSLKTLKAEDLEPTALDSTPSPPSGGIRFDTFWGSWPKRNGKRVGRRQAEACWARLDPAERQLALVGAGHYATASASGLAGAMDAHRWLRHRCWADWQEPAVPDRRGGRAAPESAATIALRLIGAGG